MKTTLLILAALSALTLSAETPAPAKAEQSSTPIAAPKPFKRVVSKPKPDGTVEIQISLGELADAQISLQKLFNIDMPLGAPATRIGLRKMVAAVKQELSFFEEEKADQRKKYFKVVDSKWVVQPGQEENADTRWKALTGTVVRLTVTPIPITALGDAAKLSGIDLANLEGFLPE